MHKLLKGKPPMPETIAPFKPVFINEMPEYQEALKQIAVLSQNDAVTFHRIINELGLGVEMQKTKAEVAALKPQAAALLAKKEEMTAKKNEAQRNANKSDTRYIIAMPLVAGGVGAIGGVVGGRRWGWIAGILIAIGSAGLEMIASGWALMSAVGRNQKKVDTATKALEEQQLQSEQLASSVKQVMQGFIESMATRMLERQVALVGEGADMKLVSTAEPGPQAAPAMVAGMPPAPLSPAEKILANGPAESKVVALQSQVAGPAVSAM